MTVIVEFGPSRFFCVSVYIGSIYILFIIVMFFGLQLIRSFLKPLLPAWTYYVISYNVFLSPPRASYGLLDNEVDLQWIHWLIITHLVSSVQSHLKQLYDHLSPDAWDIGYECGMLLWIIWRLEKLQKSLYRARRKCTRRPPRRFGRFIDILRSCNSHSLANLKTCLEAPNFILRSDMDPLNFLSYKIMPPTILEASSKQSIFSYI